MSIQTFIEDVRKDFERLRPQLLSQAQALCGPADVYDVRLIGSVADGTATETSDIDLGVYYHNEEIPPEWVHNDLYGVLTSTDHGFWDIVPIPDGTVQRLSWKDIETPPRPEVDPKQLTGWFVELTPQHYGPFDEHYGFVGFVRPDPTVEGDYLVYGIWGKTKEEVTARVQAYNQNQSDVEGAYYSWVRPAGLIPIEKLDLPISSRLQQTFGAVKKPLRMMRKETSGWISPEGQLYTLTALGADDHVSGRDEIMRRFYHIDASEVEISDYTYAAYLAKGWVRFIWDGETAGFTVSSWRGAARSNVLEMLAKIADKAATVEIGTFADTTVYSGSIEDLLHRSASRSVVNILTKYAGPAEGTIDYPTPEEIIETHDDVVSEYGGREGVFPETIAKLEAAIGRMQSGGFGQEFYPSLVEKTAVLMHSIISTHPFPDANKRTAFMAGMEFLHHNGFAVHDSDTIADAILAVADDKGGYETLLNEIRMHAKEISEHHDDTLRRLSWKDVREGIDVIVKLPGANIPAASATYRKMHGLSEDAPIPYTFADTMAVTAGVFLDSPALLLEESEYQGDMLGILKVKSNGNVVMLRKYHTPYSGGAEIVTYVPETSEKLSWKAIDMSSDVLDRLPKPPEGYKVHWIVDDADELAQSVAPGQVWMRMGSVMFLHTFENVKVLVGVGYDNGHKVFPGSTIENAAWSYVDVPPPTPTKKSAIVPAAFPMVGITPITPADTSIATAHLLYEDEVVADVALASLSSGASSEEAVTGAPEEITHTALVTAPSLDSEKEKSDINPVPADVPPPMPASAPAADVVQRAPEPLPAPVSEVPGKTVKTVKILRDEFGKISGMEIVEEKK